MSGGATIGVRRNNCQSLNNQGTAMTTTALPDISSSFYLVASPPRIASKTEHLLILLQGLVRSVVGDR